MDYKNPPSASNEYVLVSGASSGIGLDLAREFGLRGHSLIMVVPVAPESYERAAEFKRGDTVVRTIGVEAALSGKRVIIPGPLNQVSIFTWRLEGEVAQAKNNEAFYQEASPEKQTCVPGENFVREFRS